MIVSSAEQPVKNATQSVVTVNQKQEVWLWAGLFLLGAISRLPFVGQILYHWDSINFALSLQHFDVALGQPHVPGYILYVFLGQLVNALVGNPQNTLAGISVVSSGLAVASLYGLGRTMFNREIGLLAALLLASSPLYWFYGVIALPHSLDTFVVIVMVWLLYLIHRGHVWLAIPAAIWLAIGGGLRPQTELFLAPLALYAGWRLGWQRGIIALFVLVVFSLAWVIPLFWLNGGPDRYFEIMDGFTTDFNTTTSIFSGAGWWGLSRNLTKLTLYTLYGWSLAIIPAVLVAVVNLKRLSPNTLFSAFKNARVWFMLLWICPTMAYYIFIHMGQQGLVFVFLPALLLLSAAGVYQLKWSSPLYRQAAIAALVMVNVLIFVVAPTNPLGGDRFKLLTADTLRRHDDYYLSRIQAMRQNFPESQTIILSSEWRFPQYYLPNYLLAPFGIISKWELGEGQSTQKDDIWVDGREVGLQPDQAGFFYVVIFDDDLAPFNQTPERVEWLPLPDGQKLAYMRFNAQDRFYLSSESYSVVSASTKNE